MKVSILTLYPEVFPGVLGVGVIGRALREQIWSLNIVKLRDFAVGKHAQVDDTPYGGGAGMLLRPDVADAALSSIPHGGRRIYVSPRGRPLTQKLAYELAQEKALTVLCGRFEGIDQRVLDHYELEEVSLGDYVLAGGEVAAQALLEAVLRLKAGVLGEENSIMQESFSLDDDYAGLLEYPHYTKPPLWNGRSVPEVLLSGHHGKIDAWRKQQAEELTQQRRPDLWERYKRK